MNDFEKQSLEILASGLLIDPVDDTDFALGLVDGMKIASEKITEELEFFEKHKGKK